MGSRIRSHAPLLLILVCFLCDSTAQTGSLKTTAESNTLTERQKEESPSPQVKKSTIASKVEQRLKVEFAGDVREAEEHEGAAYNQSANSGQASMETVVRVSHKQRPNGNLTTTLAANGSTITTNHSAAVTSHEIETDVDRMIDAHDNEFVLSKSKNWSSLTLDPVFVQDLTILYTSAAGLGLLFETFSQPVINGYFVAGSVVGTGGFRLITEQVQVQSLAQLGVQLLLFHLGLEFSLAKMQTVGGVAFVGTSFVFLGASNERSSFQLGGLLEMCVLVAIAVGSAALFGANIAIGAFIGALVSLSSTSVVANCLETNKTSSSQYGQITIGTLILQDCTVGIMFAIMPLIAGQREANASPTEESPLFPLLLNLVVKLILLIVIGTFTSRNILPPLVQGIDKRFSQELFQILLFSYCCLCALLTGWIGLSHELGAFVAGCMLSSSRQTPKAIKSIEGARNIFMTLFMASIGLMMSPAFIWEHLTILTCGTLAVILCKASVVAVVVRAFRFDFSTSLLVGLSLAQISEFAFVLLSVAVDSHLLETEMYLLLLGVTGLSLLCTPLVISTSGSFVQAPNTASKAVDLDSGTDDEEISLTIEDPQVRRHREVH